MKMSKKKMEMSKMDKKSDKMQMHKSKVKSAAYKAIGGKY